MKNSNTPGGMRLRALREYFGRTQLDVELDAHLGIGYLQRVESGKVQQPEHDTLERILAALGARYTERRTILEMFGYVVDTPLPDEDDIRWAAEMCRAEINNAVFPAYLLDCAHRLLAWNSFVPKFFPVNDPGRVGKWLSVFKFIFDSTYPFAASIANPDIFFPAQIRAFRYEMYWFHDESWYGALMDEIRQYPLFEKYWSKAEAEPYHIAARPLAPLEINLPEVGLLQFRLISEPFAQDRRFRVIYYLPAEPKTMQQCLAWLKA
jgi:transcriptional regulator with XRE-family HTH domain